MLEAQRIHLRLFMEGVEVPIISASVSASIGAAASATIQIPGHDSALYILPKTMVHVFFYDWEYDHLSGSGVGPTTDRVGKKLETPAFTSDGSPTSATRRDLNYKLLFCGEVISVNFAKDGFGSQTITLACSDCSSVLDSAYIYQTQYHSSSHPLINQDTGFYGGNSNPFDDIISTPERVIADFIKQNRPKNPALRDSSKTVVGGLFSFFEVLLGVHGYSYGLDTFYTVQERRLRLMEQIVSDDGKVAAELFDEQVFNNWITGRIGGTPAVMSFREVSQLILNYVFYQQVPNPVGYYQWGSKEMPTYQEVAYTTDSLESAVGRIKNAKMKQDFLKLDGKFGTAIVEVLNTMNTYSVQIDQNTGKGSIVSKAEATGSGNIVVGGVLGSLNAAFRDYEKRAKISGITLEKAKTYTLAHEQGMAVDIGYGLDKGWSLPDKWKHMQYRATWWSFIGVSRRTKEKWLAKSPWNGFAALVAAVAYATETFGNPEGLRDFLYQSVDDYEAFIIAISPADLQASVAKADAKRQKTIQLSDPATYRPEVDTAKQFAYLDFWLNNKDPNESDWTEGVKTAIDVTLHIAQEHMLGYEAIGKAVAEVNATGQFDSLNWGGTWSKPNPINNLFAVFGNIGWDPVHVQSHRHSDKVILRDPKILNDDWENRHEHEKYTPSVQDILEGSAKGADEAEVAGGESPATETTEVAVATEVAEKVSYVDAFSRSAFSSKNGRERLLTQIYRPDVWFCPPPICNNIFPDEYSSLTFSRPMMREVTRLKLTSYHQLMEDVVVNKYYFAPQFKNSENLEEQGIGEVAKVVLYPHEIYTGVIPKIQKLSEASFYTKAAAGVASDVGELSTEVNYQEGKDPSDQAESSATDKFTNLLATYGARVAHFHLLTARYASRSGSLLGRFMPRIVPGFPAAIYQRGYNNKAAISSALSAGIKDFYSPEEAKGLSQEIFDKTKPIHYQCMVQSVTHTISQGQANTSISFTHARSHKTDSGTDDLLSAMAKSGGFEVPSGAALSQSTSKVVETIYTDKQKVYGESSAFFVSCKELYEELFDHADTDVTVGAYADSTWGALYVVHDKDHRNILKQVKGSSPGTSSRQVDRPSVREIAGTAAVKDPLTAAGFKHFPFIFKEKVREGKVFYYDDPEIGFNLQDISYPGLATGALYTSPEGQTEYLVGQDQVLFSVDVESSFADTLAWNTSMYIKVPVVSTDSKYVNLNILDIRKNLNPNSLYKALKVYPGKLASAEVTFSLRELFDVPGAKIITGSPLEGYGGDLALAYELTEILDDGSWEGYLIVKLRPRFKALKLFYGTVSASSDTATTSTDVEPWEVAIRPGWFSATAYSNNTIGETYRSMFGCDSVITKWNLSPKSGYSTVSTEQAMDHIIAQYESTTNKILWIHRNCSRGDANLIEVIGKKDPGKEKEYLTGGFHSSAFGDFSNLEALDLIGQELGSLLDPTLKKIKINAGDLKIDPRQSRRNAILYYLSNIMSRGIRS